MHKGDNNHDLDFLLYYALVDSEYNRLRKWKDSGIHYYYFFNYIPKCEANTEPPSVRKIRNIIWRFKNGIFSNDYVEKIVITKIKKTFRLMPEKFTFVCIPASTKERSLVRYLYFSRVVCRETGMQNGLDYVRIIKDGPAKHIEGEGGCEYECDNVFFNGKNVIVFDDIITRGDSLNRIVDKLERAGAKVWAAFFLGKTSSNSLEHPWIIDEDNINHDKDQAFLKKIDELK